MTDVAVAGDFGMIEPPNPALEAARREALEYLRLEQWGQRLPAISGEIAIQVQVLRAERLERQAEARRAHAERNEAERLRALEAQRIREQKQREAGEL